LRYLAIAEGGDGGATAYVIDACTGAVNASGPFTFDLPFL